MGGRGDPAKGYTVICWVRADGRPGWNAELAERGDGSVGDGAGWHRWEALPGGRPWLGADERGRAAISGAGGSGRAFRGRVRRDGLGVVDGGVVGRRIRGCAARLL